MTERFLLDCWYQMGFSHELTEGPLARTIADIPVVAFRAGGEARALLDRCPHRFAPLSTGRLNGETIECGYHGLAFDGTGRCVHNPHGAVVRALDVRNFPLVERHGCLWVWVGHADRADADLIPDFTFIDETPETARIYFTIPIAANYRLVSDNLLDLSHADFLHPDSLGGVMTGVRPRTDQTGRGIAVEWCSEGVSPPPRFREMIGKDCLANAWTRAEWTPPAVILIKTALTPTERERKRSDEIWALHSITPQNAGSSHYFVCGTRRDRTEDADYTERLRTMLKHAFENEDKPMLEGQQERIGSADFDALRPAILPTDAGSVLARRQMNDLIAQEQAQAD